MLKLLFSCICKGLDWVFSEAGLEAFLVYFIVYSVHHTKKNCNRYANEHGIVRQYFTCIKYIDFNSFLIVIELSMKPNTNWPGIFYAIVYIFVTTLHFPQCFFLKYKLSLHNYLFEFGGSDRFDSCVYRFL